MSEQKVRVWVKTGAPTAHGGQDVTLWVDEPPYQGFGEGLEYREVEGTEGQVLVSREELRQLSEKYDGGAYCALGDCEWPQKPHACALRFVP